jgi:carboxylesterase type B
VFGNLAAGRSARAEPFDATDTAVSQAMRQAWAAFARNGDPHVEGAAAWPAYTAQEDAHLTFGDTIAVGHGWRRDQLDFLDRYYDREA